MNKSEAREFLRGQSGNVWAAIRELSIDELREARKVAAEYSTTNCWFVEFNMKDSFLKLIDDRITDIEAQRNEQKRTRL